MDGKIANVPGASPSNPIIGRVAFWTDDESCKVNINTASEGSFWDTPRATYADEVGLNKAYPVQGEFQRYAGHPATISLSAIFPWLKGTTPGTRDNIFASIAPRIAPGGSLEGTNTSATPAPIRPDADRLYNSVDELAFDATRAIRPGITQAEIEQRRFFLTAQSRSPETTLFNTPRVAVWPLHADRNARHVAERLIALAASTGQNPENEYYFTRAYPLDPTRDFLDETRIAGGGKGRNQKLFDYLREELGLPIPGWGRSFEQKWGADERDQILTEIYDYVRSCINLRTAVKNGVITPQASGGVAYTGVSIPGNRVMPGRNGVVAATVLSGTARDASGRSIPSGGSYGGGGGTRGFGRTPTVKEVALFFGAEQVGVVGNGTVTTPWKVWPAIAVELFLPSQGPKNWSPNIRATVSGLDSLEWEYKASAALPPSPVKMFTPPPPPLPALPSPLAQSTKTFVASPINSYAPSGAAYVNSAYNPGTDFPYNSGGGLATGYLGASLLHGAGLEPKNSSSYWLYFQYGLKSDDPSGPTIENWDKDGFTFKGGTITITVDLAETNGVWGEMAPAKTITGLPSGMTQTFTITFPPATVKWPNPTMNFPWGPAWPQYTTFGNRLTTGAGTDFIIANDVVKSMVPSGDYRMLAGQNSVPASAFTAQKTYDTAATRSHSLGFRNMDILTGWDAGAYVPGLQATATDTIYFGFGNSGGQFWQNSSRPLIPAGQTATNVLGRPGDWDNGIGIFRDGPYINKVDEGLDYGTESGYSTQQSYLDSATKSDSRPTETLFGPMRQIASPVFFGSLPTGVKRGQPWQTLLFCPNPAAGFTEAQHEGFKSPPDHLLLDLFWMPVTEPYAISDRFSTAGKINLNYQMVPFSYIQRTTGLHAVLANEKVAAFDESRVGGRLAYKQDGPYAPTGAKPPSPGTSRYAINIPETLKPFDAKFQDGQIFKSATQICEMFLVPDASGINASNVQSFWNDKRVTGDNVRERPYNAIYPRVTTQSNVYTTYVKVEVLKQIPSSLAAGGATFTEGKDIVEGSFQGSYTFERYLDPNAPPRATDLAPLGPYKLRVINQRNLLF